MSTSQPSLFGAYPWATGSGVAPSLFAEGFVPQSYSLTLSDAVTDTDAEIFSSTKVLAETVTISEATAKTLSHSLADSVTPSVAIAKTLQKVFAETGSVTDSGVIVFTIKHLSDFLILKEWISIRLTKSLVWTNPSVNANLHDTLWGKYTFGSQLFGGVKPASTWNEGTQRRPSVWTNSDGAKYNY